MYARLLFPLAAILASISPTAGAAEPIDAAEQHALLALIRPGADEDPFATIPWQISLWEARAKAAKEGKPILLWEMDGHPLGCG